MSPRSSSPRRSKGPPPDPDVYVALLLVATLSLIVGCALFWSELSYYTAGA